MAFKPAICPSCGGSLQIPDDRDTVSCMYCNSTIVVREVLSTKKSNLENIFRLADTASEAGNHEEAYGYYTKILEEDGENPKAWFGKGESAGWQSNLLNYKVPEMVTSFQKAIEYSGETEKKDYIVKAANLLNQITVAYYALSREHFDEFVSLDNSWYEYLDRCSEIISALELANEYKPDDELIIENIIHICKDNMEGASYYDDFEEKTIVRTLTPEYEKLLKAKFDSYNELLKEKNPDYKPPSIDKKDSSCFVVTATMGDEDHHRVRVLRDFRDTILLPSYTGEKLIAYYYLVGPHIAKTIEHNKVLRKISYALVVLPASELAKLILSIRNKQKP